MIDLKAAGFWVPKSTFDPARDIPDLTGKVIIVTGANTGIGKETARVLLSKGAKVYAACRSEEKANQAINDLKQKTGKNDIHFLKLDLGSVKTSAAAADEFLKLESKLDILINSAGVMFPPNGSKNDDGLEMQFGTNVVSPFAFSEKLFPLLRETAKKSSPGSVRVVWVSSSGHYIFAKKDGINFDSINKDVKLVGNQCHYGQSKLANIQMSNWAAEELKEDGVVSLSLHPGNIASDLTRHYGFASRIMKLMLYPLSKGALTQLYCAASPEITISDTGSYWVPWARRHPPSHPHAIDPKAIEATMEFCRSQVSTFSK